MINSKTIKFNLFFSFVLVLMLFFSSASANFSENFDDDVLFNDPSAYWYLYSEQNDPVGGQWVRVNRPGIDEAAIWNVVGNAEGSTISNKADATLGSSTGIIYGADLSDPTGMSDKKYAEANLKIHVPDNAFSGQYTIITRVEYTFV